MPKAVDLPVGSVAIVLGTRPEVVKLAHIVHILGRAARVVHSGQHFSPELARLFLEELDIDEPDVQLVVGGVSRGQQIGEATRLLDDHFASDPPLAVIVQGDTNTVAAGALAANARGIPLVHVESGLRSFDRAMPEEHNRVVADHLADLCCAPTEVNRDNLASEGIRGTRVVVTGNTVVEAVERHLPEAAVRQTLLRDHGLEPRRYVLSTFHRPENVDDPERLNAILHELADLPMPVVLPVHPRTEQRIKGFGLGRLLSQLIAVDSLGYRTFLALASECAVLVSDSGGVQEEASVIKRPVVVVRNSTERPEVLGTFAELIRPGPGIGKVVSGWLDQLDEVHDRLRRLPSPYGDGTASQRSVDAVLELLESQG